jgi:hypothetical protein
VFTRNRANTYCARASERATMRSTAFLTLSVLAISAATAQAAELPLKAPAIKFGEGPNQFTGFVGVDVARLSYSGFTGVLIAPQGGVENSGLRAFILGEAGTYKYPLDATTKNKGNYTGGEFLLGYGFEGVNYSVTLLAGANVVDHTLSQDDPDNSVQGTKYGAKGRLLAWINPTPQTLIASDADYSTAFRSYYARMKLGYDMTPNRGIFIGPEAAALGNERFDQWRVGAHITQMKFGKVQMDLSAGFAHDTSVGNGAYTSIEFSVNF